MTVIPSQFELLSKLIDVAALRHEVISQNVANVNTPGYHRLVVSFEEELAKALQGPAEFDVSAVAARVDPEAGLAERADGNNVDIDKEMGQLNKNALLYQTYVQVLAGNLNTMKSAITGR